MLFRRGHSLIWKAGRVRFFVCVIKLIIKKVGDIIITILIPVVILFLVKLFDCAFGVLKTMFIVKDRYFLAAICASLSVVFFVYAAQQSGEYVYVTIFLATFLGNYLPPKILNYLRKDKLFIYEVISNDLATGKEFADKLRTYNLQLSTNVCLNNELKKVVSCRIYSKSKDTSRFIEDSIPTNFNYNVIASAS